jgi:ribosomal protein S18 acetylase RimI-like enzyme
MGKSAAIYQIDFDEKEQAVEVLTAAFYNYPVMRYFLEKEELAYGSKLRSMVAFFCEVRLWKGLPPLVIRDKAGAPVAAALINPPVMKPTPPQLRRALRELREQIGSEAMDRIDAYEGTCERMEPEAPHYYLGMIGVLPGCQGKGYARMLLDYLHETADKEPGTAGVCLNTENPNNVPLYRRFGYEVIGETDVGPLHTWCMFRPSNSGFIP